MPTYYPRGIAQPFGGFETVKSPSGAILSVPAGTAGYTTTDPVEIELLEAARSSRGPLFAQMLENAGYREVILDTEGLLAYYRLGEGSGTVAADESGNGNDGTYVNTPTLGATPLVTYPNTAVLFDGVSEEMTFSVAGFDRHHWTFEGFVNWQSGGSGSVLLRDHTSVGGLIPWLWESGTVLKIRMGGVDYNTGVSSALVKDAGPKHIVTTYDDEVLTLYIDSQPVWSNVAEADTDPVMPFHLMNNGLFNAYANGTVDEFAVYNRALQWDEIAEHFTRTRPPHYSDAVLALNPLHYLRLNEPDASAGAADLSGNGNAGAYVGSIRFGDPSGVYADSDPSVHITGTSYINVPTLSPFTSTLQGTFVGLASRDDTTGNDTLVGGSGSPTVMLRAAAGGTSVVFFWNSGGGSSTWTSAIPTAQWFHWALSINRSTNTAVFYVNGVNLGAKTSATAFPATPGNLRWGIRATVDPWLGNMDEVAYIDRVLSDAEVLALYRSAAGLS